jgi:hypothetical protein
MCFQMIATAGSKLFEGGLSSFIEGLGTTMSVAGPIVQGMAAKSSADAQAQAAEYNAEIAEAQAEARSRQAAKEERLLRIKGKLAKGSQRAAFGAAGLDPNAGSPLDILLDTQWAIEEDANTIRYNAALDRWGLMERSKMFNYQAEAARSSGSQAMVAGAVGGLTNLGTSMSKFSDKWDWMSGKKTGTGTVLPDDPFSVRRRAATGKLGG